MVISDRLTKRGYYCASRRHPNLEVPSQQIFKKPIPESKREA